MARQRAFSVDFVADTYKDSRIVDPDTIQVVLKNYLKDRATNKFHRGITNQAGRAKRYAQAADIIAKDVRDIYIAHARVPVLMRKNVDGFVAQPTANEYMETIELK